MAYACSIKDIIDPVKDDESKVQRISHRKEALPIHIVPADSSWPAQFQTLKANIATALGTVAQSISHVGSTSVPGLWAKPIIDIDLIVRDISAEDEYVPALQAAGWQFLLREPEWNQHRLFTKSQPGACVANLHVFAHDAGEPVRHAILRDWLREHEDDRELYQKVKIEASEASTAAGETMMQYTDRKNGVIQGILGRAFRALGLLDGESIQ